MKINSIKLAYFSPTQTTKKILASIAQGMQVDDVTHIDLTLPKADAKEAISIDDELVVIGAPVYAGRIPVEAIPRLMRLKGNGAPSVIVVLYGNRAYDDALLELREIAQQAGFETIAGAAFIGEHSYSTESMPIAKARPDERDLKKAREFGRKLKEKLRTVQKHHQEYNQVPLLQVPGKVPYRERMKSPATSPTTEEKLCIQCGQCVEVCPTAAVYLQDSVETNKDACIRCCACVKNCPTGARIMNDKHIKMIAEWLYENYRSRKEPEIFL